MDNGWISRMVVWFAAWLMLSPSAADTSSVHASTIAVDRDGKASPVGLLASMPNEDASGGGGRKTDVV